MTLENIHQILLQAVELGTINSIYFEGGEPFLYYAIMLRGIQEAVDHGFKVGIVTNSYWATEVDDALVWLRTLEGLVQDLSISSDLYHGSEELFRKAQNACQAAEKLEIPIGVISVAQPEVSDAVSAIGQLPSGESSVMYRGRAAEKLATLAEKRPWQEYTECPHENFREPGRVHLDPLGYVHICQGISLGNVFQTPLKEICELYDPDTHPITSPLLDGGPAELVHRYDLPRSDGYADACHLCYEARQKLRDRFPDILTPDQMYGVIDSDN
jgi:MoaA/NifB/PqqE/SkfB family radical SAM enzyme